ncbi:MULTISPECIES: hypothetical protein [unclassified Mycobacterium]|uniref:hypothetical protein n=1 Tax=unclassified Mycobacterium TaxID=2642494 RepID=UPI0029C65329|nr:MULTISPECIES: hypothetical protein [unclassified Mycobacterium]
MAGSNERTALAEASEGVGWQRRVDERVDIYVRGPVRVRVIWQGDDAISGGSRFQDDVMESYSRDLTTVKGWLSR